MSKAFGSHLLDDYLTWYFIATFGVVCRYVLLRQVSRLRLPLECQDVGVSNIVQARVLYQYVAYLA